MAREFIDPVLVVEALLQHNRPKAREIARGHLGEVALAIAMGATISMGASQAVGELSRCGWMPPVAHPEAYVRQLFNSDMFKSMGEGAFQVRVGIFDPKQLKRAKFFARTAWKGVQKAKALQGRVYGHWTVVGYGGKRGGQQCVRVRCVCGFERSERAYKLGQTASCGCRGLLRPSRNTYTPPLDIEEKRRRKREKCREYRKTHREAALVYSRNQMRRYRATNVTRYLWELVRKRAEVCERRVAFTLTPEDVEGVAIPEFCPVTGDRLGDIGQKSLLSPTLARRDIHRPWERDNVMIVTYAGAIQLEKERRTDAVLRRYEKKRCEGLHPGDWDRRDHLDWVNCEGLTPEDLLAFKEELDHHGCGTLPTFESLLEQVTGTRFRDVKSFLSRARTVKRFISSGART